MGKGVFAGLHRRLGDFWWYSVLIFLACRVSDALNAFIGLWLVPKYVSPSDLGAVMPLTHFANFLAIPVAVFAATFRNELTRLAIGRDFGRLKSLMRGVFIAALCLLLLALVVSRLLLPHYLERLRVGYGSLGFCVIFASFAGSVCPIYVNAIQAMKKFRGYTVISVLGAPVRMVAMLVAMPFRALSGYFVGQAATPVFSMGAAVLCLRRELSVPAVPYWTRPVVRRFATLFALFALGSIAGALVNLVEMTVLRQRLPEADSAGFYMATRFSDIAGFLYNTLAFTIFPYAAEQSAKGRDLRPLVLKTALAVVVFSALVAVAFAAISGRMLLLLPHGGTYAAYAWAVPCMIGVGAVNSVVSLYTTAEISANRFGYLRWLVPVNAAYSAAMMFVTGYGYFLVWLPSSAAAFLERHNIRSLEDIIWWFAAGAAVRLAFCAAGMVAGGRKARGVSAG